MTWDKTIGPAEGETPALIDEAAQALREGRTRDALKLVRRALEAGFTNPGVHLRAARLLRALGEQAAAVAALQRSLALEPGSRASLDEMQQWGLLTADAGVPDVTSDGSKSRTPEFDLAAAARALREHGVVVLARFATAAECADLGGRGDDDPLFVFAQDLATPLGRASRAVLREPLRADVRLLVAEAYARAAEVSNDLRATLRQAERFPAGEPRPMALSDRAVRLSLAGGSGHPPRRDAGDRQSFPLCGVVALGASALEVRLHDLRPGKPRGKRCVVPPRSLALFCARERPVAIGGVLGLQAIEWELAVPDAGEARALLLAWPHAVSGPAER